MVMLPAPGGGVRPRGTWAPPHALRFITWPSLLFAVDLPVVADGIEGVEAAAPAEVRSEAQPIADGARAAEAIAPGANLAARLGALADNRFVKPAVARPTIPPILPGIPITGEQLDLSEWVHIPAHGPRPLPAHRRRGTPLPVRSSRRADQDHRTQVHRHRGTPRRHDAGLAHDPARIHRPT